MRRTGPFSFDLADADAQVPRLRAGPEVIPENEATPGLKGFAFRAAAALDNRIRNSAHWTPYARAECTKVVCQGDSWFAFPLVEPEDVSECLGRLLPVFTLGCPGDNVADMAKEEKIVALTDAVRSSGATIVALSGGGNELIGEDFPSVLRRAPNARAALDHVDLNRLEVKVAEVCRAFEEIFWALIDARPSVQICAHSYDYPFPNLETGTFLGPTLSDSGIPPEHWYAICAHIIDRFDNALVSLSRTYQRNFFRVDLRGISGADAANWSDEIHLDSATASRAAERFVGEFRTRLGADFKAFNGRIGA